MPRKNPCNTTTKSWSTILEGILNIPMNQRSYSWTKNEVDKFLSDLIDTYEENEYTEYMGTIISLDCGVGHNEIYDGQQRTITTFLIFWIGSFRDIDNCESALL